MVIGVPREGRRDEHRVGLTPFAVARLAGAGCRVLVERGAGEAAYFSDEDYLQSGAERIVYAADELYGRADMVCQVNALDDEDLAQLKPGSVVCGFHHLAVTPRERLERILDLGTTLIGWEMVGQADGAQSVLVPFSEMAGQLAVQLAAHYLQNHAGGRGVLLGNLPGVPPPTVLILGAGHVGRAAARQALGRGVHGIVLDRDVRKLAALHRELPGPLVTVLAAPGRLERYTGIADVLIGAVLERGERTPLLVSEDLVSAMKPGSVIIDVAIDQGGCVETARPTTLDDPVFVRHGVTHYCVPNMTSGIARTASRVLAQATLPFVLELVRHGLDRALHADPGLREGVYAYRGQLTDAHAGRRLGLEVHDLARMLDGRSGR